MCGIVCIHNNDKHLWFAIHMLVVFQNFVNLYIWYVLCVGSFSLALFQALLGVIEVFYEYDLKIHSTLRNIMLVTTKVHVIIKELCSINMNA